MLRITSGSCRNRKNRRMSETPEHPEAAQPDAEDTPPERLSADPDSPFFNRPAIERGVGIRFKGRERQDVEEYSTSEGWIRAALGKKVDRRGKPLTITLKGEVEAYWRS